MKYPDFELQARAAGDKRDMVYLRGALEFMEIDLSSANALQELTFKGDVIYLDRNSTGEIGVKLDTAWPAFFPLSANSALRGIPYEQILLNWAAQPGKVARMWFGYGVEIVPPNQDITTIGSITDPIQAIPYGYVYGSSFVDITTKAANAAVEVFSGASNTNGAILYAAEFHIRNQASFNRATVLAKSSTPASPSDGEILLVSERPQPWQPSGAGTTSYQFVSAQLKNPIFIDAGLGVYFCSDFADDGATRMALYTLL